MTRRKVSDVAVLALLVIAVRSRLRGRLTLASGSEAADPDAPATANVDPVRAPPPAGEDSHRLLIDAALLLLIAGGAAAIAGAFGGARPFVVFVAACLVPGGALLTRLRVGDPAAAVGLAIGLSLGVEIVGSLALVWSGFWHPVLLAAVLGVGSTALIGSDLSPALQRRRRA